MGFRTLKKVITDKGVTYFEKCPSNGGGKIKFYRVKESHYKWVFQNLESISHDSIYEDGKNTIISVFLTK